MLKPPTMRLPTSRDLADDPQGRAGQKNSDKQGTHFVLGWRLYL
jgi:hypothetical protein